MMARFFADSGIFERCFWVDFAHHVPGLSQTESKAYEFLHSERACARVRARPQNSGTLEKHKSTPDGTDNHAHVIPSFRPKKNTPCWSNLETPISDNGLPKATLNY